MVFSCLPFGELPFSTLRRERYDPWSQVANCENEAVFTPVATSCGASWSSVDTSAGATTWISVNTQQE
jgi:hypothetical protein